MLLALALVAVEASAADVTYRTTLPVELVQNRAGKRVLESLTERHELEIDRRSWSEDDEALVSATQRGEVHLALVNLVGVAAAVPATDALRLAFLVDGPEHVVRGLEAGGYEATDAALRAHDLTLVAVMDGTWDGLSAEAPIEGLDTLKGLSIATWRADPWSGRALEALGATVVPGVKDDSSARANALLAPAPFALRVARMGRGGLRHAAWTDVKVRWSPALLVANEAWWDGLDPAVRATLLEGRALGEKTLEAWARDRTASIAMLRAAAGVSTHSLTPEARAPMIAATAGVRAAFVEAHPAAAPLVKAFEATR